MFFAAISAFSLAIFSFLAFNSAACWAIFFACSFCSLSTSFSFAAKSLEETLPKSSAGFSTTVMFGSFFASSTALSTSGVSNSLGIDVDLLASFSAGATSVGCPRGSMVVSGLTTGCSCADFSASAVGCWTFVVSFEVAELCSAAIPFGTTSSAVVG